MDWEQRIINECLRLGEPIPDRIKNAPQPEDWMEFYVNAFHDLSTDRQIGFAEGPIPFSSILRYANHYGLNDEDEADLTYFVRLLDNSYLKHSEKKNKPKKTGK